MDTSHVVGLRDRAIIAVMNYTFARVGAVIALNAIFGGAEIRIPENWELVMRGAGIFGGYSDETVHPNSTEFPNPKRLVLKGAAVFGGINVKN